MVSEVQERYRPKPEDHAEIQRYYKQVEEITKAPLNDRREAAKEYFEAMRDIPKTVGERVQWLLEGNYGYGSYVKARQIAALKNMNRVQALGNMVAELEWQCPSRMATEGWKKLTPAQQQTVNNAVVKAIQGWEAEEGIKATPVRGSSGYLREPGHEGGRPRRNRAAPRLTR
jgi:hypothetical protein